MTETRSLFSLLSKWHTAVAHTIHLQPPAVPAFDKLKSSADLQVSNIVEHTGDVIADSLFVARVRTGTDGHPHIGKAIALGAIVIFGQRNQADLDEPIPPHVLYFQVPDSAEAMAWLAAAWNDFPGRNIRIIGVTGTNGKTTTSTILFGVLKSAGIRCGLINTVQAIFGDLEEPTGLHVTTPGAVQLQGYLRRMVDAGLTHCILETTSHGLAQHRVTGVPYEFALITNITHEHIDYHGSFENYALAKQRLFELAGQHPNGRAILNSDDSSFEQMAQVAVPNQTSFGQFLKPDGKRPDVWATNARFTSEATCFDLYLPGNDQPLLIKTELLGQFNVSNILCVAATAHYLGVSGNQIAQGVAKTSTISGRMEPVSEGQPFLAIVDFAHTPDALQKAIEGAKTMLDPKSSMPGRIITVFGSAGKRDIEKRRIMAEISAKGADISILTAEDPRTESLDDILEMMAAGCRSQGAAEGIGFWRIPDRGQAIFMALTLAQPADIVLICGKGHEQSMCFGTTEYPWDDRQATRIALKALIHKEPMPSLGLPTETLFH
ncbi:MAG: UDP-N-acetylmuramoyl-L-alanyl-D-glutamate--2,6-diaminopimelate ligase [Cellvibrionaceae bacterium]|jgi:UDP-N-acetylmuramoyl-L-alanyl-D-glutamate--2,6-diaminopimelate ligase